MWGGGAGGAPVSVVADGGCTIRSTGLYIGIKEQSEKWRSPCQDLSPFGPAPSPALVTWPCLTERG